MRLCAQSPMSGANSRANVRAPPRRATNPRTGGRPAQVTADTNPKTGQASRYFFNLGFGGHVSDIFPFDVVEFSWSSCPSFCRRSWHRGAWSSVTQLFYTVFLLLLFFLCVAGTVLLLLPTLCFFSGRLSGFSPMSCSLQCWPALAANGGASAGAVDKVAEENVFVGPVIGQGFPVFEEHAPVQDKWLRGGRHWSRNGVHSRDDCILSRRQSWARAAVYYVNAGRKG